MYIFCYFCNSVWCCLGNWSYITFNDWTERKYVGKQLERFTIAQDILCAIPQCIPEPSLVKFWMEFSINGIVFVWMKRFSKLRWLASPSQMQIFTQHPLPAGFSHSQPHTYRLTKHTQPVLSCSIARGSWYNRYLSTLSSHPAIRAEHCCQQKHTHTCFSRTHTETHRDMQQKTHSTPPTCTYRHKWLYNHA